MNKNRHLPSQRSGKTEVAWLKRSSAILVLGLAVVALGFAWPRLMASVHYLPVDAAQKRYYATAEVPVGQLDALVSRASEAIKMHPHYRYFEGLSFLHYLRALSITSSRSERWQALQDSLSAANEAVRKAPARPATWLRIARIRSVMGQGDYAVVPPLNLSILTGRVEPSLLLPRLELGLKYVDVLDAETVAMLRDQAVLMWRDDPRVLVSAIRQERVNAEQVKSLWGEANAGLIAELESRL